MSMPDEFYLPRPKDFCRGDFTGGETGEKHCFIGWQRELLPFPTIWLANVSDAYDRDRFLGVALAIARKMDLHPHTYYRGMPTCFDYNDDTRNTPEQLAEWFERTVKALGYDIS